VNPFPGVFPSGMRGGRSLIKFTFGYLVAGIPRKGERRYCWRDCGKAKGLSGGMHERWAEIANVKGAGESQDLFFKLPPTSYRMNGKGGEVLAGDRKETRRLDLSEKLRTVDR